MREAAGLVQKRGDLAQKRLKADAAVLELRLLGGHDHGVVHEVAGKAHSLLRSAASHNGGEQARAVQVTSAVQHVGQQLVVDLKERSVLRAHEVADEPVAALDALEDNRLGALCKQCVGQAVRLVVGDILAGPR